MKKTYEEIAKQALTAHMELINLNEALKKAGLTMNFNDYKTIAEIYDKIEDLFEKITEREV